MSCNYSGCIAMVDDDPDFLELSRVWLEQAGVGAVLAVTRGAELLPLLTERECAVVLLDLLMPGMSGLDLLPRIVQQQPNAAVIMLTASQDMDTAIACMKLGAADYLVKPVERNRLVNTVAAAVRIHTLQSRVDTLKQALLSGQVAKPENFSPILTSHPGMWSIFQYIESIARSREPVLITGETGVGKELVAKAVHAASAASGAMVRVNLAGLDDLMFADTLFGHRKGAFTGAEGSRSGLVAMAEQGTLFLDEIGDLQESSQIKLLRLLQEQEYYQLGADTPQRSNARLVMATHKDVKQLVAEGRFRNDLYYRMAVHEIHIPPLRSRKEDIPLLTDHFLAEAAEALGKPIPTPPKELYTLLGAYDFPGNIRELRALIFDAVARHTSRMLSLSTFQGVIQRAERCDSSSSLAASETEELRFGGRLPSLRRGEELLIQEAMRRSNGNQGMAAAMLGISRQALNRRLVHSMFRE